MTEPVIKKCNKEYAYAGINICILYCWQLDYMQANVKLYQHTIKINIKEGYWIFRLTDTNMVPDNQSPISVTEYMWSLHVDNQDFTIDEDRIINS